jgi:hypothetical protein
MSQQGWRLPITRGCVLVLQDAGRPMHYREISEQLAKRGLISSRSKAVERCVYSGMSKHIRTAQNESWFAHAGRGTYRLTAAGKTLQVWRGDHEWAAQSTPKRQVRLDMTWNQAATRVLREAGEPLHVTDILNRIWSNGYKPRIDGAVPDRTLGNLLAELARKSTGRRGLSITRTAPGTYGLR